jgi:sialic acid synthase SpsE
MMKRKYFHFVAALGTMYGMFQLPGHSHWFDAESQLEQVCRQQDIAIFNSVTVLENKSLYNYEEPLFFKTDSEELNEINSNDKPVINDSTFLFFLRRN